MAEMVDCKLTEAANGYADNSQQEILHLHIPSIPVPLGPMIVKCIGMEYSNQKGRPVAGAAFP